MMVKQNKPTKLDITPANMRLDVLIWVSLSCSIDGIFSKQFKEIILESYLQAAERHELIVHLYMDKTRHDSDHLFT